MGPLRALSEEQVVMKRFIRHRSVIAAPRRSVLALVILLVWAATSGAQSQDRWVRLAWDPGDDPTAIGTFLYYWQLPSGPTNKVDVLANMSHTVNGLTEGVTYAFYVTAYNALGLESEPSNVIEFTPLSAVEDTPLPSILRVLEGRAALGNFVITGSPAGTLDPPNGPPPLEYRPAPNFSGKAEFTYELDEGWTEPVRGWVSLLVAEGDDDPSNVPEEITVQVEGNVPFRVIVPIDDPDTAPDFFVSTIVDVPLYGAWDYLEYPTNSTFHLIYWPDPDNPGWDVFKILTQNVQTLEESYTTIHLEVQTVALDPLSVRVAWTRTVTLPAPALLSASVTDITGTPVNDAAVTWTVAEGPAPVLFTPLEALITPAFFAVPGTYLIELTAATDQALGTGSLEVHVGELISTNPISIFVEAEEGSPADTMSFATEITPGGEPVQYAEARGTNGVLRADFWVPEDGDYLVWCRVKTTGTGSDSFFVSMDDDAEDVYDASAERYSEEYQWTPLCGRMGVLNSWEDYAYAKNGRVFQLEAGEHTLKFRGRESGTRLDCFMVVNQSAVDPSEAPYSYRPTVNLVPAGESMGIAWNAIQGVRYQIESTPSVLGPWEPEGNVATASNTAEMVYPEGVGAGFYRVKVLEVE